MRKILFPVCMLLAISSTSFGRQRTVIESESIARSVLMGDDSRKAPSRNGASNQLRMVPSSKLMNRPEINKEHEAFYLYSSQSGTDGYVLVSADDRMPEILGYSTEGGIDFSDIPQGMLEMMNCYAQALQAIESGLMTTEEAFYASSATEEVNIEPLLGGIMFKQGAPYNGKCPVFSDGKRAVVGCGPTALAQVMRYYKWPQDYGTGVEEYTSKMSSYTTDIYVDFSTIKFDWDNILETYKNVSYTQEQADALATLCYAASTGISASFSPSGSGSSLGHIPSPAHDHLGYDAGSSLIAQQYVRADQWAPRLQQELKAGHPVLYKGMAEDGSFGHIFVIDGVKYIDHVDYYHVNWGWEGSGNAYFLLTRLIPVEGENINKNSTYEPYTVNYGSNGVAMIVNFAPEDTINNHVFQLRNMTCDQTKTTFSPGDRYKIQFDQLYKADSYNTFDGVIWACLDDMEGNHILLKKIWSNQFTSKQPYLGNVPTTCTIPSDIQSGYYYITATGVPDDGGTVEMFNANAKLIYVNNPAKPDAVQPIVSDTQASDGKVYDLTGKPVANPANGQINIIDGKKVLIRE
ncbi:MAG: C10 family peptidase [Bacteroidaceae bacterium]|nr:C10 family peptidase [Bacteroidaceae bacterium]